MKISLRKDELLLGSINDERRLITQIPAVVEIELVRIARCDTLVVLTQEKDEALRAQSCGEACAGWRIYSLVSILRRKDMGN